MPGFAYTVSAAADEDVCSDWAAWDIFMAEAAYNLGNKDTYSDFQGDLTWGKFEPVLISLQEKLLDGKYYSANADNKSLLKRADVITHLYITIITALEIEEGNTIDYFVENGIMKGRADGDYQLDNTCTVEEMLVFAVRTYEYIIRELGLDSKGFFWRVTGENNTIYLLGSIHISDGSLYPLNIEIEKAFESSANFVVEVHDNPSEEDIEYYMMKGYILDGTTIEDYLDPDIYEFYEWVCQSLGIPKEVYDYLQPWLAEFELGYLSYAMTSQDDDIDDLYDNLNEMISLGIESHFIPRALAGGKNILQLESLRHQADFLSSFSPELQEVLLFWTLVEFYELITGESFFGDEYAIEDALADESGGLLELLAVWKSGDEVIWREMSWVDYEWENPLDIEYNYIMGTLRNIAMTEQIIIFLTEGEDDYFIVVGTAHMFGADGIVELLIAEGYEVERII